MSSLYSTWLRSHQISLQQRTSAMWWNRRFTLRMCSMMLSRLYGPKSPWNLSSISLNLCHEELRQLWTHNSKTIPNKMSCEGHITSFVSATQTHTCAAYSCIWLMSNSSCHFSFSKTWSFKRRWGKAEQEMERSTWKDSPTKQCHV